ncbi:MAG TPA: hypothetical protein VGA09_08095 [Candidatus Binatia bacterium]
MKRLQKLMAQITPKIADVRVETVVDTSFMNKLESSGYIQAFTRKTNCQGNGKPLLDIFSGGLSQRRVDCHCKVTE